MLSTTELVKENTQLKKDIDQKDQRITLLEEMLRVQRHKDYGASSEKDSGQGQLFNEAEGDSLTAESEAVDIVVPAHTRKNKKRVSIPADLPREDIIHDLAEADKVCPHDGSELTLIGEETSEQLDIEPAKIKVLRHRRQKYACPCCEQYLITATKPAQPIEKSIAAPGLLAYVAVSKYCDALPLYRQIAIFKRIGIELDRTTLANWMIKMGVLVQPLINRLSEIANEQSVLHMDDLGTPLWGKPASSTERA